MSSGVGLQGTIGRCYPFYADIRACVAKKTVESPADMCVAENSDYFECLHGFKEKARRLQVLKEQKRREALGESFPLDK
eukprot:CAMPEP_0117034854 /NCGR_PEP_ID=MMETSP0472-20121206/24787_1 /TAXON_ID=693140 ORGANISM="Tiarina fusus, Strain LIS" /NCGR_SAMPLE_ID=MMETSP0472 /ASSEMBLY_ACC=CAM_ASM_000603 /LENGTH=78 /DNA_ID=CAMNT_0004744145 /DNA_START=96 /DNA_END=332 /DNA_ORIENTATION=-